MPTPLMWKAHSKLRSSWRISYHFCKNIWSVHIKAFNCSKSLSSNIFTFFHMLDIHFACIKCVSHIYPILKPHVLNAMEFGGLNGFMNDPRSCWLKRIFLCVFPPRYRDYFVYSVAQIHPTNVRWYVMWPFSLWYELAWILSLCICPSRGSPCMVLTPHIT